MNNQSDDFRWTDHALQEITRRQIKMADVVKVLKEPEQIVTVRPGRLVFQARGAFNESSSLYLLRVFVDVDRHPPEVVTAYRTSKIDKYWNTT
ncbi:MAG: DUF4258 domain-containing protein [Caldilineales bacterium]